MASVKTKDGRARNFATVVYPESAPEDFLSIIGQFCIPVFVSPLHDQDLNPTGEPKKPHYHVLFAFEGKKSVEQVQVYVDQINGVGVEIVGSLRGYARYLCHLDNPEKHQYAVDDVRSFAGADYIDAIGLPTDKYKMLREMVEFCDDNDVDSFADLADYASNNRSDWFRILADSGTIFMTHYLKSKHWTKHRG